MNGCARGGGQVEVVGHAIHIEAERRDDGTEYLTDSGLHIVERSFGKVCTRRVRCDVVRVLGAPL